jgi:hypothetical protein
MKPADPLARGLSLPDSRGTNLFHADTDSARLLLQYLEP